jgi:hypothetical protein
MIPAGGVLSISVSRNALSQGGESARRDVLTEPGSETGLIEVSTRQRQDHGNDLLLGGFNAEAIQAEKEIHGLEGDAFVPINEGMVIGQTESICGSESGKVCVSVVMKSVARSFEG